MPALVPVLVRLSLVFGPTRALTRPLWSTLELEDVVRLFRTPRLVEEYMHTCFRYHHDVHLHGVEEVWQSHVATFTSRSGDCEDYAIFARHVLEENGYDADVFAAFTDEDGHAVCVYREAQTWYTIANEGIRHIARLGRRPRRIERARRRLARRAADVLFPRGWTVCGFVVRLEPDVRHAGGRVVPYFEWVHPRRRPGAR